MKKIVRVLFAATALVALSACALLRQAGGEDEAMRAAKVALTAYADFVQPAIKTYGALPTCGADPAVKICKDKALWAKLKAAEAAATSSVLAAQSVFDGTSADTGQIAQALADIAAAQAAFKSTNGES